MTTKDTKLQVISKPDDTRRTENPADPVEVGQWYWLKVWEKDWDGDREEYGEPYIVEYLVCVIEVGSNYAKMQSVDDGDGYSTWRIHEDEFDTLCRREPNAQDHINAQIAKRQANVNMLMDRVKQLTAGLGVTRQALAEGGGEDTTTALVKVQGTENVKAHKAALIKAKEETLPDLFKKIEKEHKAMAGWMKSNLIPYEAEAKALEKTTKAIEDRIFTVELYAGLIEEMVQVKKGKPAPNDTKIHLMQRRHYMDEECLWNYQAGGMEFTDIRQFDKWLRKKENALRIFPHPRCIVAFKVRRKRKRRLRGRSLSDFINIYFKEQADKATFIYIRNGGQLWRLSTGIDFGEELFPHKEDSITLGEGGDGPLWANVYWSRVEEIISDAEYQDRMARYEEKEVEHQEHLKAWRADPKNKEHLGSIFEPSPPSHYRSEKWEQITKESVYYDDAMKKIAREAMAHNRVVVVLQGILDRSPALQPHPPWQLFTTEGFQGALELVYDTSRALVDGEPPDFEAYRKACNESLKRGCVTVGQQTAWLREMARKENERRNRGYYNGDDLEFHKPYGNPGPGLVAPVIQLGKKGATFEWERERLTYNPYGSNNPIKTRFRCPVDTLFNVNAYKPGDYKQFYDDPRTRADYDIWAPILLAAEDWHAEQTKKK